MADRDGAGGRSWTLGFLLVLLTSACSGTPAAPTPSANPTDNPATGFGLPIPAVSNPSSAAVTGEDSFAVVRADGSRFAYEVRFRLREISGKSGATVTGVVVYGPSGSDETNPACWRDSLRVPALGSLDTFYTDDGAHWLGYCGPGSGGNVASPSLHVIVTFTDDYGVTGSIGFPISSLR